MKHSFIIMILLLLFLPYVFLASCHEKNKITPSDTPRNGAIEISVDESFEPVIREQIAVYEASFPGTKIIAHYKTEADCLKDFFHDSANRMVIVTRGLTDREEKYMTDSIGINPGWEEVATDAIAVIVNSSNSDTLYTLNLLQQRLTGKVKDDKIMVFDGLNKTSTVRFIEDSILRGQRFDTAKVRGVKNSDEVINYVATHENAIGFVGINRIGNPEDPAQTAMLKNVKICYVKCDVCVNSPYVMPSQESILNRRYPLVRGLHYIVKENFAGLGSGFATFLKYERGQLIFKRAYLGAVMGFRIRDVQMNSTLPKN